jgi:hypothetical protein
LGSTIVFKTSLEHLVNNTILMLLNSSITIIQRLCFRVSFCTIAKGYATVTARGWRATGGIAIQWRSSVAEGNSDVLRVVSS